MVDYRSRFSVPLFIIAINNNNSNNNSTIACPPSVATRSSLKPQSYLICGDMSLILTDRLT